MHRLFAQTLTLPVADDEELSKINLVRLFPIQRVGDDFPTLLEQERDVLAFQPPAHALHQLGNGHFVPVLLVTDQLVVEFREQRAIGCCGASPGHVWQQANGEDAGKQVPARAERDEAVNDYRRDSMVGLSSWSCAAGLDAGEAGDTDGAGMASCTF